MTEFTDLDVVADLLENGLDWAGRWSNDTIAVRSNHEVTVYKYLSASQPRKGSGVIEYRMERRWKATIPEVEEELEKRGYRGEREE